MSTHARVTPGRSWLTGDLSLSSSDMVHRAQRLDGTATGEHGQSLSLIPPFVYRIVC